MDDDSGNHEDTHSFYISLHFEISYDPNIASLSQDLIQGAICGKDLNRS